MTAVARIARLLLVATLGAALLGTLAAGPADAATFSVRLEAGPHTGRHFSTTWKVTATRKLTLTAPATVTADRRTAVAGRGIQIRIASGTLAGWWVRENRLSYRPGVAETRTYSPATAVVLRAGSWETYRFDASGTLLEARGRTLTSGVTAHADRRSVIDGRTWIRLADGPWPGWWLPGTAAAPKPITCTTGNPPTGTTGRTVRAVSSAAGEVALTFDMGGRLDPALKIIRFLVYERVCATIFPTGVAAQTPIGRQVLAEVRAHPELFEVGNHTVHHCNLRDGGGGAACPSTRPSDAFAAAELADADAIIESLAGRSTAPYWRPPYGAVDSRLVNVAAAAGYAYNVMWSTDTIDWRKVKNGGPTAWQITSRIRAGEKPGAIVLMHLGGWKTRASLPATIHLLAKDGYRPTTLSDLSR